MHSPFRMDNLMENRKILIAEDNPNNIQLLGSILRQYKPQIVVARDGRKAVKSAIDLQPDLILMDVNMPEMDGYEACRKLKEHPETQHIPVLFLSARSATDDIVAGFAAGGVDYIQKPYIEAELIARIQTHLKLLVNRNNLKELIRTKDRFFGIIAHDLKNPFLNIVGYSEYIQENLEQIEKQELLRYINSIFQSAFAQNRLLDNLLEWSAFQTGSFTFTREKLSVDEMASDIFQLYRQVALTKQIRLLNLAVEKLYIWADKNMVNTVLRNLVSNALKFTPAGHEIRLLSARTKNTIEISISDQGVGMSEELIRKIFAEDLQLTRYGTAGEKGTGLGLKLCKEFIRANQGTLRVQSAESQGTTITLVFPSDNL